MNAIELSVIFNNFFLVLLIFTVIFLTFSKGMGKKDPFDSALRSLNEVFFALCASGMFLFKLISGLLNREFQTLFWLKISTGSFSILYFMMSVIMFIYAIFAGFGLVGLIISKHNKKILSANKVDKTSAEK